MAKITTLLLHDWSHFLRKLQQVVTGVVSGILNLLTPSLRRRQDYKPELSCQALGDGWLLLFHPSEGRPAQELHSGLTTALSMCNFPAVLLLCFLKATSELLWHIWLNLSYRVTWTQRNLCCNSPWRNCAWMVGAGLPWQIVFPQILVCSVLLGLGSLTQTNTSHNAEQVTPHSPTDPYWNCQIRLYRYRSVQAVLNCFIFFLFPPFV